MPITLTIPKGAWEYWNKVKINNLKDSVSTPWNPSYSATAIPDDIRFDIRAEDGWIILLETLSKKESKMNYMIFYNKFTGYLKGFYYSESTSEGNNGLWQISFENPDQKFLHNQDGFFSYPIESNNKVPEMYIMNVTKNKTKGFTEGWNCFELELSYFPNQSNLILGITSYHQNIGTIELEGNFTSSSSGTIISSVSAKSDNNTLLGQKSMIKILNDSAKSYFVKNLTGSKIPFKNFSSNLVTSLLKNNFGALFDEGIASIFGSALSSSNATPTNFKLEFKTTGDVKLTGKVETPSTTSIPPLKISIPDTIQLGIWNTVHAPMLYIGKYAKVTNATMYNNKVQHKYKIDKKLQTTMDPLINPEIKPFMINCIVQYSLSNGHFSSEVYNTNSATRKKELDKLKNISTQRILDQQYSYLPMIYNDGSTIIQQTSIRTGTILSYVTEDSPVSPNIKCYSDNGLPYLNIQSDNIGIQTEDVKVFMTYLIHVNGVNKIFNSVRTYDPSIHYYDNVTPCVPYAWKDSEIINLYWNK
jgi:hypothetical protein